MIDLSIIKENPELAGSIKLELNLSDLIEFAKFIHDQATAEAKKNLDTRDEPMTPEEFARALNVSLVTLWTWDKKKILTPFYVGNRKYYRRSDLDNLMNNQK